MRVEVEVYTSFISIAGPHSCSPIHNIVVFNTCSVYGGFDGSRTSAVRGGYIVPTKLLRVDDFVKISE